MPVRSLSLPPSQRASFGSPLRLRHLPLKKGEDSGLANLGSLHCAMAPER
ncbi:hypothetical protein [Adhaeribacter radiodurans]|uniref:Uncharacterized protein n=1 Tax=Adhaeribacter radiodurans TaxID=2745197 RepID=A0A7L7LDN7_9BACT|nr:hypothetical protein [Adhaeribacter radiodurans]QMU30921.1 hypothetical protein HUW48_24135 [Adhaeribacter radiodurans]